MKAKLSEKEPELIKKWENQKIYEAILSQTSQASSFFLLDGPPYANGPIHIGHTLNKILKDIVVKYKNLRGFKTSFIPSWDCHGLPIELKAMEKNSHSEKTKKEIRDLCRKEAYRWIENQKQSFKRLGVLADWNQPMLTMDSDYEAEEVRIFGNLVEERSDL